MPRGGARSSSGPPRAEVSQRNDREAARRAKGLPSRVIDDGEWLTLAREGRTANPPAWPLTLASGRERALWRLLWKRPQALGWELVGAEHQVAVYVRSLVRAEEAESPIGLMNVVRLQQHELGLTAGGLRALKWRIARPSQVHAPSSSGAGEVPAAGVKVGKSPKERMGFRLVGG